MIAQTKDVGKIDKVPESIAKKSSNTINLIPEITSQEKKKIEGKENVNLTSAALVFLVMLFTVGLLLYNFSLRSRKSTAETKKKSLEVQLDAIKTKELKLKNVLSKYDAIQNLKKSDLQYSYLTEEVSGFPTSLKVKSIVLSSTHEFEISGLAFDVSAFNDFVKDVEASEDFANVNIDELTELDSEQLEIAAALNEDEYKAQWKITGDYFKNISTEELSTELNQSTQE